MTVVKSKGLGLKSLREKLGLTQQQMAERLNVKRRETISEWETGKHHLRLSWEQVRLLDKLANEVGVRLKDLPDDLAS